LSITNNVFDSTSIREIGGPIRFDDPGVKKVLVGGQSGYSYRTGDAGCVAEVVQTALKNRTLKIAFSYCFGSSQPENPKLIYENADLIDKILSTFKFTK